MAEFVLKYADPRGEIHQQVAEAGSERELRDRYAQQGFLIYSIKPKGQIPGLGGLRRGKKKINLEKFLIFNQQFVTLVRAGLPILKSLDLLADRLTDPKLGAHITAVRDEVHNGGMLSQAFGQQGVFPSIYVTSVLAGEKSGSLSEVLERYISYQKMAMAVRKKLLVSLLYPSVLIVLVICLIVFLVTYVVPNFAKLYESMQAQLPAMTLILIAVGTTARNYIVLGFVALVGLFFGFRYWSKTESGAERLDAVKLHTPILGDIWVKYQVAQFARVLSTLLVGGIPLVQALETASESLGTTLFKKTLEQSRKLVREGQA
ncbi:MAG: type II secretion system F family protein, partial [Bryobacteraceae bacterium]